MSPSGASDSTPIASEMNQVPNDCQNVWSGVGVSPAASSALNNGVNITAQTTKRSQQLRSLSGSIAGSVRRSSRAHTAASSRLMAASLTGMALRPNSRKLASTMPVPLASSGKPQ
ncbi:Uncharacterised protein [Acinetobacter baumannii]|nr:Uncharacterised protein [Acinetobacter baumannii]